MAEFRGFPACSCLVEWLPHFEAELRRRKVITDSIDIAQLIGGAEASGGTHATGGAWDIWQHDALTQVVAREMGAAAWNRVKPWWTGSPHTHGVLNGCPHNGPARYQIDALAAGFNGLGAGGRGGPDYGQGPRRLRTWREGIEWAIEQGDDDMKPEDWTKLEKLLDDKLNGLGDIKVDLGDGKAKRKIGAVLGDILGKVRSDRTS